MVELLAGWRAGSLALLADAGHMVTDGAALGLSALAAWLASLPPSRRHSYGLGKAELLAALVNALTSAKGAPPWVGLREPQSAEAILLSAADRLSGCFDLIDRHAPKEPGFGRFHPHLGNRPFVVARSG